MGKIIQVGLVGLGFMGSTHGMVISGLKEVDNRYFIKNAEEGLKDGTEGVTLAAICDRNEDRRNGDLSSVVGNIGDRIHGIDIRGMKTYSDPMDLIRSDNVDAVHITLPTPLHAQYFIAAIEAGKHVFIEKPLALDFTDADKMLIASKTAASRGQVTMVGNCIDFWFEYDLLADAIQKGAFSYGDGSHHTGKLVSLEMKRSSAVPGERWFLDGSQSGSALYDLHVHDSGYIRRVMGMPDSVRAVGCNIVSNHNGIDLVVATYKYAPARVEIQGKSKEIEQTIRAQADWNPNEDYPFEMSFRAVFETGGALILGPDGVFKYNPAEGYPLLITNNTAHKTGWHGELAHFYDCIREKTKPEKGTVMGAYDNLRLLVAEHNSIAKNREVELKK